MDEMLNTSLDKGEEILWRGHAEPFETLDKTHKPVFIRRVAIGAAIAVAFALLLGILGGLDRKSLLMIVIVALLCAIPAINMISDGSKLKKKMEYVATTERLIILRDAVRSVYYSQIKTAAFKEDQDGHVSLLCGPEALKAKPSKWREICVVGAGAGESTECERFCFYAPADRKKLEKVLHEKMPSLF